MVNASFLRVPSARGDHVLSHAAFSLPCRAKTATLIALITRLTQVYAWGWGRYGNVGDGERVDRCAGIANHNTCSA